MNHVNIPVFKTNHNFLESSFFPSTIMEWKNLDPNLRNSDTYGTFKKTILKFVRPSPHSVLECHNPQGIQFLTSPVLVPAIFVNINSRIVFKFSWIHYVSAVLKLNRLHISCSTVPFTTLIDPAFWALLEILILNY